MTLRSQIKCGWCDNLVVPTFTANLGDADQHKNSSSSASGTTPRPPPASNYSQDREWTAGGHERVHSDHRRDQQQRAGEQLYCDSCWTWWREKKRRQQAAVPQLRLTVLHDRTFLSSQNHQKLVQQRTPIADGEILYLPGYFDRKTSEKAWAMLLEAAATTRHRGVEKNEKFIPPRSESDDTSAAKSVVTTACSKPCPPCSSARTTQKCLCEKNAGTRTQNCEDEDQAGHAVLEWSQHHALDLAKFRSSDGHQQQCSSQETQISSNAFHAFLSQVLKDWEEQFDVTVRKERVNLYTESDWKPFHQDSHGWHTEKVVRQVPPARSSTSRGQDDDDVQESARISAEPGSEHGYHVAQSEDHDDIYSSYYDDVTIAASFGIRPRDLAFRPIISPASCRRGEHEQHWRHSWRGGNQQHQDDLFHLSLQQNAGDVLIFDSKVNDVFEHGVPEVVLEGERNVVGHAEHTEAKLLPTPSAADDEVDADACEGGEGGEATKTIWGADVRLQKVFADEIKPRAGTALHFTRASIIAWCSRNENYLDPRRQDCRYLSR
ncbi:unnamed protein product [Amoebophrya sp. A120]|nr:unnamed protein product [Amoebophrya sp. A120]|eukprot:GSA120T00020761001.1